MDNNQNTFAIEAESGSDLSDNFSTAEPSYEDEVMFIISMATVFVMYFEHRYILFTGISLPLNRIFPIWQPPKIS